MNSTLKIKIWERFKTQADFAQAIREHESDVSRVVHGRRVLPPEKQRVWAEALGCDVTELFNEDRAQAAANKSE
jgi:ribosome-binding protein aMBF1 (putative translation factor)